MQYEIFIDKSQTLRWISEPDPVQQKDAEPQQIRYVDLFSGCGGMSYGIYRAAKQHGCTAISALAIDSNPAPLEVYRQNIPHDEGAIVNSCILDALGSVPQEDISETTPFLKKKVGPIEILVAGPPCQGHSDLNNSTRRSDPRNSLYLSCIRAVELFQPNLVVIENVPSVIHSSEGVVKTTEERLSTSGYRVRHLSVNFLDLGIPQARRRHVLVASKDPEFAESLTTLEVRCQVPTLKEFLSGIQPDGSLMFKSGMLSPENVRRAKYLFDNNLYDLPDQHRPACHRDKAHSYRSAYGRLSYERPAQTLTSGYGSMGQGRYIHPEKPRTLNSREAARIQGFPDCFSFKNASKLTDLRQMIANAVPPQLTYSIVEHYIRSSLSAKMNTGDVKVDPTKASMIATEPPWIRTEVNLAR